jgi:PLP dependent protein
MSQIDPSHVATALAAVRSRIAAACARNGRDPHSVAILAVTKGFGPSAPEAAIAAGLTDIGENYYQEAAEKFTFVSWPKGIARHFIGRVQRNKARRIAATFDVVQTVDDLAVARALDDAAAAEHKSLSVLVQLNAVGDERQGLAPGDLADFVSALGARSNLRVRGLMAMGPKDPAATAEAFARAAACFEELRLVHSEFDTLSMGMSDDIELAVAAGSTMLRIGTALFGARSTATTAL